MAVRTPRRLLLLLLINFLSRAHAQYPLVTNSECNCFQTNGSSQAFFTQHLFFDFRSLSQYADTPAVIQTPSGSADALAPSEYFSQQEWTAYWIAQTWNNSASIGSPGGATVLRVNSPNNVYIQNNTDENPGSDTYLTLRTERLSDFQSTAEIQTVSGSYLFASIRMLARTTGSQGACTSLFTFYEESSSTDIQEAALAILTDGPQNMIQYTNQPGYTASDQVIPQATRNATMPEDLVWSDWSIHRLDWTPGNTTWYVDGLVVADNTFQVPTDPSVIHLNAWSDGGTWSGNMSVNGEAYLQVQWIEMVFNSTEPTTKRDEGVDLSLGQSRRDVQHGNLGSLLGRSAGNVGCEAVCSIDDTNVTGTPVLVSGQPAKPSTSSSGSASTSTSEANSTSGALGELHRMKMTLIGIIPSIIMLALWASFL